MTFFAAVYGQEIGRLQAGWVARARAERLGFTGRPARPWNESSTGSNRAEWRAGPQGVSVTSAPIVPNPKERESMEEEGERWDGLS